MTRPLSTGRVSRLAAIAVFAGGLLAADVASAQSSTVSVRDAWVREAAGSRKVTAVFAVFENKGDAARSIVSGSTDVADTLELHEMKRDGVTMRMSPIASIVVPAQGQTELKPGSLHIMLFGLKKPLTAGDSITLTLTLDDGTKLPVAALVRKMGGMK